MHKGGQAVQGIVRLEDAAKLPNSVIVDIMRAGTFAPSPDNNQPWRFEYDGSKLALFYDDTRKLLSDKHDMLNYLSLGMAIYNMRLCAAQHGYQTQTDYFPYPSEPLRICHLWFKAGGKPSQDYRFLLSRRTNRSLYDPQKSFPDAFWQDIRALGNGFAAKVMTIEGRDEIGSVARAIWLSDTVRLSYRSFWEELCHSLHIDKKSFLEKREGLYVGELGLPRLIRPLFKLFTNETFYRILTSFKMLGLVLGQSKQQVLKSRCIGVLSIPSESLSDFVEAGELFEQWWLAATKHGISFHPMASFGVFNYLALQETSVLSPKDRRKMAEARELVLKSFPGLQTRIPLIFFRMGYSKNQPDPSTFVRRPER